MTIREFAKEVISHDESYMIDEIESNHFSIDGIKVGDASNHFFLTMLMGFTRCFNDEGMLNISEDNK